MKRLAVYTSWTLLFVALLGIGGVSSVAFATDGNDSNLTDFNQLIVDATDLVNTIIILLTAVCVVVFIVGLIRYVFHKGAEDVSKGRTYMIYSVIAFAVLTALFALANFLAGLVPDSSAIDQSTGFNPPDVNNVGNGDTNND